MQKLVQCAFPGFHDTKTSVGLLVLRLLTGFGIMLHGWGKVSAGHERMAGVANMVGLPAPFGYMAAFTEFFGGILINLGLLTPLAAIALIVTMIVAAIHHITSGDPFIGGYELASVYLVTFFAILMAGPGKFSVDYALFKNKASTGVAPPAAAPE